MSADPPNPLESNAPVQRADAPSQKPPEPILGEVVRDEVRKRILPEGMFGVQVAMGAAPNAFIEKLQPGHIDKVLDYTREEKTQEHWRIIYIFGGGVLAFLLLCAMFLYAEKDAILEKLVAAFIGFIGGFGVGKWGTKK